MLSSLRGLLILCALGLSAGFVAQGDEPAGKAVEGQQAAGSRKPEAESGKREAGGKPVAAKTAAKPETVAPDDEVGLPAGHSWHGEAFNEGPRQAAYLMPGTGDVSFPVSSKVKQVQEFINQGVGQLHGFWYFEAERSFRQAACARPRLCDRLLGHGDGQHEYRKASR